MSKKGFTLVEILIAISIIAILMGFIVPNFLGVRIRARDARRKSDLSQLQKAIELFRSDQNPPIYPNDGFMDTLCNSCWDQNGDCSGNIYLKKLPCDPQTGYTYIYTKDPGDELKYILSTCLENPNDPDRDPDTVSSCVDEGKVSYTVNEP